MPELRMNRVPNLCPNMQKKTWAPESSVQHRIRCFAVGDVLHARADFDDDIAAIAAVISPRPLKNNTEAAEADLLLPIHDHASQIKVIMLGVKRHWRRVGQFCRPQCKQVGNLLCGNAC